MRMCVAVRVCVSVSSANMLARGESCGAKLADRMRALGARPVERIRCNAAVGNFTRNNDDGEVSARSLSLIGAVTRMIGD